MKLKSEKNSGLNVIRNHNLCGAGQALYQLGHQANWELVTLSVRDIAVEGIEFIYLKLNAENDIKVGTKIVKLCA